MKNTFFLLLLTSFLWTACSSQQVANWQPKWFLNSARRPASALPTGYQIKHQDHWLLGVWESDESSPFLAVCKVRKTPIGFEAGSSKDVSGAAIMKVVQDQRDQKWLDLLVSSTTQGFEDGYSPYWSDCRAEGSKMKCDGRLSLLSFLSSTGVGEYRSVASDLYEERNAAVVRGSKTWHSSSNSEQMLQAVRCLCAKYSRDEEKEFFPATGCE